MLKPHLIDNLASQFRHTGIFRPRWPASSLASERVSLGSGQIRLHVSGQGRHTVLLCPDPPNGLEHYTGLIGLLAPEYRVIAFEAPGFGYSVPALSFDYTISAGARLIGEVLDHTRTDEAILALPCVAGLHALAFALDHPERVTGLLAIQTPDWEQLLKWKKRTDSNQLMALPHLGQLVLGLAGEPIQQIWYKIAEPDTARRAELIRIQRQRRGCLFCLASALQALKGPDPFAGRQLALPAAILWGGADKSHRRTPADTIARYLTDPVLTSLPAAGHFPELTEPARFQAALADLAARC
ncbi:MAG: alpha/beta fold hydrolase [Candidatus Sericytochromatia bacterium]